jgi:hypothetical protein
MFDKYRSVRYLREERNANRPLGAVDDDDDYEEEVEIRPNYSLEAEDAPRYEPSAPVQHGNGISTWAQIARKVHPLGMAPLPAPRAAPLVHPAVGKQPQSPINVAIATRRISTGPDTSDTLSGSAIIEEASLESLSMSSAGDADDEGDGRAWRGQSHPSHKKSMPGRDRVALPAPIDSTDTIRERHCADCAFCQMREHPRG